MKVKVKVLEYARLFVDEMGNTKNLYPDNYVTLLPEGKVGGTVFTKTPEEILGGENHKLIDNVISVRVIESEGDPVGIKTVVSETVLPSFEGMDSVGVLKVA